MYKFDQSVRFFAYDISKSDEEFHTVCFLKIPNQCNSYEYNHICYCEPTFDTTIYNMLVNVTSENSYKMLRFAATLNDYTKLYSEPKKLPRIVDKAKFTMRLFINNEEMDVTNCSATVNSSQLNITSKCVDTPSPCWLEAFDTIRNQSLLQSEQSLEVLHEFSKSTQEEIELRQNVCHLKYVGVVYCTIRIEYQEEYQVKTVALIVIVTSITVIIALGVLIIVIKKSKNGVHSIFSIGRAVETALCDTDVSKGGPFSNRNFSS
ncbi:uncharacterized protein LOC106063614 isoform X3 [Biomphalaria glabrata]|uniref:Uncharacterized protein LOC106063614 isoform X3 n=1 Tax=Biomphalaria glabrata TaxID=6526 RepID=A0A9W2YTD4_BIOGL|nr:uncharacterized protein LOC106063614 isoform X3 [Biomphalaria glabrata]XP_055866057.1 uncharacterized protein LOC106063614 isoform X3 [Biomphalaria glabrata]XP_055866058.1 uncharacterized protein LOC106063614 isoform X3 [Biomphalaria glabrata]